MKIGFIGLGAMGAAIAANLLKAGHELTVWNRSPAPAQALAEKGAKAAGTPGETLNGEVLFSMLASDAVMRDVGLDGPLLDKAAKGLLHVNVATISVAFADALTAAHESRGLGYVAAPVFGRPDAAEEARLVVTAAGKAELLEKLAPLFGAIGRRTEIVGATPSQANLFKIAGNFMIASMMETMGEAFTLLRKGGVDAAQFQDVMASSLFACPIFQNYGRMIVEERFEPAGFKLPLGLKDLNLAREAAADLSVRLPLAEVVATRYDAALKLGWTEKDWSALTAVIAREAGL